MNFLPAEIRNGRLVLPMAELALPTDLPEQPVIAGIRPEHFEDADLIDAKSAQGAVFEVQVELLEWLGADLYVHFQVECAAERLRALPEELERATRDANRISLVARVDPSSRAAENQRLKLWLDSRHLLLFDARNGENLSV
ncbi:MAG: hypothetical protein A3G81_24695 [Betaproteobacteria bacterium RIFCSPLOWO2_12_FULL_65_14]|nr:MAG: hypothetical protein A3G81_24695 [Betaproteobacteria bacterium RIFCSPLOWO2_12_FULL_65_14]